MNAIPTENMDSVESTGSNVPRRWVNSTANVLGIFMSVLFTYFTIVLIYNSLPKNARVGEVLLTMLGWAFIAFILLISIVLSCFCCWFCIVGRNAQYRISVGGFEVLRATDTNGGTFIGLGEAAADGNMSRRDAVLRNMLLRLSLASRRTDFTAADYDTLLQLDNDIEAANRHGATRADIDRLPTCVYNRPTVGNAQPTAGNTVQPTVGDTAHKTSSSTDSNGNVELTAIPAVPEASLTASVHDDKCSVCLSLYDNGDVTRILPCLHKYHRDCIDPWLTRKASCPVCKMSIY